MDDPHALPQQIADALARGWTVLTANQRAARTLRRDFDIRQQALSLTHWQPPPILAWDTWLESLWHRLLLDGHAAHLLLNQSQEHTLWRAIIAADPGTSTLRPVDSLAELAATAWLRLHNYRARRRLHVAASTSDTRAFARWATGFERSCLLSKFLTAAQLPESLAAAIDAGQLAAPPGLLLVGFDSQTPVQIALLDALRAAGTFIEEFNPAHPATTSSHLLVDAPDRHTELAACARWLRDRLTQDPHAQLAVIVPNIDEDRAQIDRAFRRILAPELDDIAAPAHSGPFEFSLGVPLAHTPLVAVALDILRWAGGALPLDRVSALLLSPHFAAGSEAATELLARAEFDAFALRRRHLLQPQLSLEELSSLASSSKFAAALPLLRRHLQTLRLHLGRENLTARDRSHADWAAAFQDLLDTAAWAPPNHLDSVEFQTRRKWESALDELATLDFDAAAPSARVSFSAALDALSRVAAQTLFAPESRHTPIQIMGPLESAGSSFDAIWFLRAGDLAWPPATAPHPLLPWLLQRELLMPGADPALDSGHARRITACIAASAPTVLFSYAQHTKDGRQRPSPVLSTLALSLRAASHVAAVEPAPVPIALDAFADDAPIPPPPDATLRGGAAILADQAACGFRAFAERRLFSSALDVPTLGLDARERGSLVHAVLHAFWAETGSQAALQRMTTADRDALLTRSIDAALARDHAHAGSGWPRAYLDAERRRLLRLLGNWLDFEVTKRPPFIVKSSEEELKAVLIGPAPPRHPRRPRRRSHVDSSRRRRQSGLAVRRDHPRLQDRPGNSRRLERPAPRCAPDSSVCRHLPRAASRRRRLRRHPSRQGYGPRRLPIAGWRPPRRNPESNPRPRRTERRMACRPHQTR